MYSATPMPEDDFLLGDADYLPVSETSAEANELDRLMSDRKAVAKLLSEHRMFKEAIEKSPVAYCIYDDDDRLVARNEAYGSLYPNLADLERGGGEDNPVRYEDLVRSRLSDCIAEVECEAMVQSLLAAQHNCDGTPTEHDYGERGTFRVVKYPLSNGAVAGMAIDITELKKHEAELVEARRVAVASERSKSTFLANMSHELRTPLNAIMGFSELTHRMLDAEACPKELEYLGHIIESGQHLVSLINDLLDLSQLEAQARELTETTVNIETVLGGMHAILTPLAKKKAIQLDLEQGASDLTLVGDERAIRQMILNLGANAIGYTPEGGRVVLRSAITAQNEIELTVEDNGPGISPDELIAIREPFVRAKSEVKAASSGAGLGLSITRHLASLHDARLSLDSEVGKGTTAHLTFPSARTLTAA